MDFRNEYSDEDHKSSHRSSGGESSADNSANQAESLDDTRIESWQDDSDDEDGQRMIEDQRYAHTGNHSENSHAK